MTEKVVKTNLDTETFFEKKLVPENKVLHGVEPKKEDDPKKRA